MSIYKNYLDDSLERLRTVLDDSGTRPILFIGSGLARRYYGSPNWIGLLEKLIELNPIISMPLGFFMQNNANDLPKVASSLVEQYQKYGWEHHHAGLFPKELYDHSYAKSIFLKSQVSQYLDGLMKDFRLEDNLHKEELLRLRSLKPHAIITTNYDNLLETIFEDFKVVIGQQVISKKEATNIGHILKIHGSTSHPEEIIISHEDYEQFEDKQKYLIAKLLTYFMEHPIIFLGYAVNDTNIRNILSDISEIVSGGSDEIVNNIWFIEWKKDEIDPDFRPPSDKSIDLGAGKTIRVNYIAVNSFEEVYTSLYQDSAMGIDSLREFQTN
ncbi:MAG TPA: SIR2 family protein, partial [Niallia sp.]|nr:SIR2 family protein [Niallia sp.]